MADKVARRGVSIYIDGSKVINSVKGIKSEMAQLTNEQAKMVYMSDEYIAHARKIAQLENLFQQHKDYQKEITKEYGQMSGAVDDFENKSNSIWGKIKGAVDETKGAIVGFLASITLDRAIDDFAELDDAMANVRKYTGMTTDQVKDLNSDLQKMDTRTSRIQLNNLAADAGRLGIQGKEGILDFVDAANILDVALGEDLGEGAVKSIGKLAQMFGDADRMGLKQAMLSTGSAINEVAQNSSAAESYLVDFTARLSGVGNQAGMSMSQLIGLGSVLDQNQQQAETSSTALSGLIMKMYQEPAKFAKIAELDVAKFTKMVKEDANGALLELLGTLGKKGGLDSLAPIFKDMNLNGARASGILSVLAGNINLIKKEQETATQAFKDGTSVINEYNVQNNTFSAHLDKAKKVLQDYVYELGERLSPYVLEATETMKPLVSVLGSFTGFLFNNSKAILVCVAAVAAYNLILKATIAYQTAYNAIATISRLITLSNAGAKAIETGNTIRAAAAQKLYYTTLEKGGAVTKAYIAVTSLLSAAKALLTGNIVAARVAMVQFNSVFKSNPLGFVIAGVIALGFAIYGLTKKFTEQSDVVKKLKDTEKEYNAELAKEIGRVNELFRAYQNTNPESEEHKRIREIILSRYGEYIKNLINEKGEITDIGKALEIVNQKLREQIALKIRDKAVEDIRVESLNVYTDTIDKIMNKVSDQIKDKDIQSEVRKSLNTMLTSVQEVDNYTVDEMSGRIDNMLRKYGVDTYKGGGFFGSSVDDYVNNLLHKVKETNDTIVQIKNKYDGMIGEMTEVDSIIKNNGGATGDSDTNTGDGGKGDKASVQRKKMQDALRTLEESHLKDMSAIKDRYLKNDIKTEEEYNQEVLKQQDRYDQDRKKKLEELLKSTTDSSLRIDIAKQIADIDAKAYDRQISDMEKRRKALAKWNDEETKKIVQAALKDVDAQEAQAEQELAMLRAKNEISDVEYRNRLLENEKKYLEERLRINGLTEEEISKIKQDLSKNSGEQDIDKAEVRTSALDKYGLVSLQNQKEQELALIKYYEDQGILTHDEAIKARTLADQNYLEGLISKASEVNSQIQSIGGNLSGTMTNFASAEESAVSRKYDKQISAAEGNSKKQKKLEEQKQKELNAIKAKYADKQFAVTTAMTIASTAQAAMEAYKAMAGIPIVGPALGAIAAGAAIAYGASQIAVAKEQRDAAKEGYFDGGYTGGNEPKAVRGYLPNGEPVHGMEFVANRHSTNSGLLRPLFDVINEAQKHNTVSSLTKKDLSRALNIPTGYYQGGYSGSVSSAPTIIRDTQSDEVIERVIEVMEHLDQKIDNIRAYVNYKGDDGIEEAQVLDEKMKKNVSR